MKRAAWIIFTALVPLLFFSCSSKRSMYKAPIKNEGAAYLISQLQDHQLKYDTFGAKFSLHYSGDKEKTSFKGNIRIKRDSMIWISIAPVMGIEIARILITPDSAKVIDRAHKSYFTESYNYVNRYLNHALDFDMLQALLIGNDFSFYEKTEWNTSIEGGLYKLATADRRKLKKYARDNQVTEIPIQNTWLDPHSFKIKKIMVKEIQPGKSRKLTAQYGEYYVVNSQRIPLHAEFDVRADENITIMLDYSRVKIDEKMKFPFHISSKYKRLSMPQ